MQAYHRFSSLPYQHVLLTIGWYSRFWWKEEQAGLSCTADQRESVLPLTMAVTDEVFIDMSQANRTITPEIVRMCRHWNEGGHAPHNQLSDKATGVSTQ